MRRLLSVAPALAVVACLAVLPACGKKAPPAPTPGAPGGDPTPGPSGPSGPAVASEFAVFAQVNAKDVIASELFAEVMKSFGAGEAAKMKAELEKQGQEAIGVKPTDLASASMYITEIPDDLAGGRQGPGPQSREPGQPKFVALLSAVKPLDKAALLKSLGGGAEPDARGFHTGRGLSALAHFPDDKTVALVHPDLAVKYLAGFAKDRSGWPVSAELSKAAAGHAAYVQVQADKLPPALKALPEARAAGPFLSAKSAVLTLDVKGKTLALNARLAFPDANTAGQAKAMVEPLVGFATMTVDAVATGRDSANLGPVLPAVQAAQKALKEAKVNVAGSDLTLAVAYTADFDIGAIVADAAKKVQEAARRMTSSNNLKQIGLALHNLHDVAGSMPVHAVGKGGRPIKAGDKPLLSWRVAILPYIEQENLYRQFKLDEPWDSEHNKKLIEKMPKTFELPGAKTAKAGHTFYQMAVGAGAMEPKGWTLVGITDGLSSTVAVAEAAEAVIWTKPDDVAVAKDAKDVKKKFGGHFPGGFNVVTWDGSVRFASDAILTEANFRAMLTPAAGDLTEW